MQQISNNIIILNPGDQLPQQTSDAIKIYLAGTEDITPGREHWQERIPVALQSLIEGPGSISVFKGKNWIIINPLSAPQMNPMPSLDNPEFMQKEQWRQEMIQASDGILINILKKSQSPLPLLDLGLCLGSQKLIVRCSEEYFMYAKVNFLCTRYNVPLLPSSSNVKDIFWAFFSILPALQQNQKLQLPE